MNQGTYIFQKIKNAHFTGEFSTQGDQVMFFDIYLDAPTLTAIYSENEQPNYSIIGCGAEIINPNAQLDRPKFEPVESPELDEFLNGFERKNDKEE